MKTSTTGAGTFLREATTILCVQPHPDDTDIALGATIAMLAAGGADITYLSVTDDAAGLRGRDALLPYGERVELRRAEQQRAARTLGVNTVLELGFPDAGNWSEYDARERIVDVIRSVRPQVVLTVDPWLRWEAHGDHRKTGFAAAEAVLLHQFPAAGTSPVDSSYSVEMIGFFFTDQPDTWIDASDFRHLKREALAAHQSQFTAQELEELVAADGHRGAIHGESIAAPWAEALRCMDPDALHINTVWNHGPRSRRE
ncbi:MAG: PIG-L family deacetylase [Spirochaetaceae bacterium]|nr:MAG: PIG-L family deacetylase [Spirochaetaceae bacterium]